MLIKSEASGQPAQTLTGELIEVMSGGAVPDGRNLNGRLGARIR